MHSTCTCTGCGADTLACAHALPRMQMNSMVAETEKDAIPVSDLVRVIMEAATAPQPQVRRVGHRSHAAGALRTLYE
jgi:hypothetical protein